MGIDTNADSLVRQLVQRSAAAYRAVPGLRGRATVKVHVAPDLKGAAVDVGTRTNTIEYILGAGTDASFELEGYGGTSVGARVFLTRSDRPDVYSVVRLLHDLPTTMTYAFGSVMFLPPQIAMHAGHGVNAIVEALGLGLITDLVPSRLQLLDDAVDGAVAEIQLRGDRGTVNCRFRSESALLLGIEGTIGSMIYSCTFCDETIIQPDDAIRFQARARREVASLSGIEGAPAAVGSMAPDFRLDTLDGSVRSLSSAAGCRLVIDFWAVWCAPCIRSLPELDTLAKNRAKAGESVAVWTVAVVETRDEAIVLARIRDLWKAKRLTLPVLIDRNGLIAGRYGIKALPTTVVVDERGIIELIEVGLDTDKLATLV